MHSVPDEPQLSPSILATTTFSTIIVTRASSTNKMSTQDPVILVTGTSRGLGHTLTKTLLSPPHTCNIIGVSRSAFPDHSSHSHLTTIQANLSCPATAASTIDQAIETYGRLDSLIINHGCLEPVERIGQHSSSNDDVGANNVGENNSTDTIEQEITAWKNAFDTNFFSAVALLKAAIPELRKSKGRVIFVSSGAAVNGYHGWGAYSASKAALNSLCQTLAKEEPDITAVAVRPGVVDTQMQQEIREKYQDAMGESHQRFVDLYKEGKLLKPEEPAAVIANLAVRAKKDLSGRFLSWDSEELTEYR